MICLSKLDLPSPQDLELCIYPLKLLTLNYSLRRPLTAHHPHFLNRLTNKYKQPFLLPHLHPHLINFFLQPFRCDLNFLSFHPLHDSDLLFDCLNRVLILALLILNPLYLRDQALDLDVRLHDLVLDVAVDDHATDVLDLFAHDVCERADRLLQVGHLPLHRLDRADVEVLLLEEGLDVLLLVRFQLVHGRLDLVQLLTQVQGAVARLP